MISGPEMKSWKDECCLSKADLVPVATCFVDCKLKAAEWSLQKQRQTLTKHSYYILTIRISLYKLCCKMTTCKDDLIVIEMVT